MIDVHFVIAPNSLILDWAGPAEALRMANRRRQELGQPELFHLHFAGPQPDALSSVGAIISQLEPLPDLQQLDHQAQHWVVVVGQAGQRVDVLSAESQKLIAWLSNLKFRPERLELLCVCAGAILAAEAGALRGRCATTHHEHLDELSQVDASCHVQTNRIFVSDGPIHSSAGVTTGIDLFLHRIGHVAGPALAASVAQGLVVALRRGPNDPELSPFLCHRNHLQANLHRLQDAIAQQPQRTWGLEQMAELACTSPRHLSRMFQTHVGMTPMQYLRRIRLSVAQAALQHGRSVSQAAEMAGFQSDLQLRRCWQAEHPNSTPRQARVKSLAIS